jgi:hypothetical protein
MSNTTEEKKADAHKEVVILFHHYELLIMQHHILFEKLIMSAKAKDAEIESLKDEVYQLRERLKKYEHKHGGNS